MHKAADAHIEVMAEMRANGALRTIHGRQYPVPMGEFMRWEAEQAVLAVRKRRKLGARFEWRKVFRDG